MSTAGTPLDPHDKMRARDVSKVARGEQAPRPPHEFGTVSPPPPPSSTDYIDAKKSNQDENGAKVATTDYQTRHCYVKYVEYHRCIKQKGEKTFECNKLGNSLSSSCPTELIAEWDKERREGQFPDAL
ncbi:putative cytochrome c oxidase subunit 6b-like isoform X1 [Arachis hypogaea]|uniref:putative cytochrome c oxidase subunit 6b-like isoform X1 n=1 Tax=Arachis hypogaea TaxID=3818 RepID=UPI000DECC68D|nr:putative cytochrome c oxidase subunit 6b-like isoform X1 [Arachis hypogaea]XP_025698444.1 putative cytochrome c oxidase subunit 6b-like isoform X1 [Arachis hypogaea]QHO40483.1 Putative cytochrome c oxidase subunit 6b-like [Arachis hypogaea]